MKFRIKHAVAAVLGGLLLAASSASATLTFTGGIGDLVFFYEAAEDRWDIVFRNKATTQATGNTTPYAGFPGNVDHEAANDVTFNALQINVTSAPLRTVNGNDYFITPANGTSYQNQSVAPIVNQPDLGIRTRLRENFGSGSVAQFDVMRLSLDWVNSTRPADAQFIMFKYDAVAENNVILYETADSDFSHDWPFSGHTHWHFGFSEAGDYSLVFDVEGIGGLHDGASKTQLTLNFNVVPEPSTALLGMVALGVLGLRRRRG